MAVLTTFVSPAMTTRCPRCKESLRGSSEEHTDSPFTHVTFPTYVQSSADLSTRFAGCDINMMKEALIYVLFALHICLKRLRRDFSTENISDFELIGETLQVKPKLILIIDGGHINTFRKEHDI